MGVFNSQLIKPLHTAFLNSINLSEYRIRIKFDKDPLAVEQNNYLTKIVNVYIVYGLNDWPKDTINNFKFRNFLSGNVYNFSVDYNSINKSSILIIHKYLMIKNSI